MPTRVAIDLPRLTREGRRPPDGSQPLTPLSRDTASAPCRGRGERLVENAQHEVDLARQRYMHVDPARRLVADSLEASWNEKLRALECAREDYQRGRDADHAQLDDQQRQRVLELTKDFPALWYDPATSYRERNSGPATTRHRPALRPTSAR